ncbi:hypothetical protein [Phenylobacterium sp.]|uniref:hypothetical protein n=1 Tax=Phenylobacterium sp. TaxID=1871053 RepID=UPI002C409141|nr:hypothetical protein [Phenylobacterium sp.]HLZ77085.1 hypothetical protein [Phenylobacterium sp.]
MAGVLRRTVLGGLVLSAGAATALAARRPLGLDAVWSMASFTDLERPKGVADLVLTDADAKALAAPRQALHGVPASDDPVGQGENEYTDRGTGFARVKGELRSSWIVEPADGRIPWRPEVRARLHLERPPLYTDTANPEAMNGPTRCAASYAAGAPMIGGPDSNLVQIVTTPSAVVILSEKYHDARIVRLRRPGAPQNPAPAPSLLGDAVGHWEGATLVAETSGFRPGETDRNQHLYFCPTTAVTERFTRLSEDELLYEFTVTDPAMYTQAWRGEMEFRNAGGRIFEYACHEGNYALPGILAGARREEREAAARSK